MKLLLSTIRYDMGLNKREYWRTYKKGGKAFIHIENWTTPKYELLNRLRYHNYTVTQVNNELTYEIRKEI